MWITARATQIKRDRDLHPTDAIANTPPAMRETTAISEEGQLEPPRTLDSITNSSNISGGEAWAWWGDVPATRGYKSQVK